MADSNELSILIFSDNSTFREDAIAAIGRRPWAGSPEVTFCEAATAPGVINQLDAHKIHLAVFDGEVQKEGAMAVAHRIQDQMDDDRIPPILFIVARQQDEWLARGAHAAAVLTAPINPIELQKTVASLMRDA